MLEYAAMGCTSAETARLMHRATKTIRNQRQFILDKLGARSTTEAVAIALHRGLIQCPLCRPVDDLR